VTYGEKTQWGGGQKEVMALYSESRDKKSPVSGLGKRGDIFIGPVGEKDEGWEEEEGNNTTHKKNKSPTPARLKGVSNETQ